MEVKVRLRRLRRNTNSNISEVSKDDNEHNSAIDKNDIHYEEKKDEDVK